MLEENKWQRDIRDPIRIHRPADLFRLHRKLCLTWLPKSGGLWYGTVKMKKYGVRLNHFPNLLHSQYHNHHTVQLLNVLHQNKWLGLFLVTANIVQFWYQTTTVPFCVNRKWLSVTCFEWFRIFLKYGAINKFKQCLDQLIHKMVKLYYNNGHSQKVAPGTYGMFCYD